MTMNKYVGNKDFSNVIHFLINRLPLSKRYFSLFHGSGGLEKSSFTKEALFICAEKDPDCKKYEDPTRSKIEYSDYKDLIEAFVFASEDFIFADPPYEFSTRTSGTKYYKYEFNTSDSIEFLEYMISLPCKIMITHPKCDLYDKYLKDWSKEEFSYMTRGGWFKDCAYMNYSRSDIELLNYNALGKDFTDRQRIKRQRANVVNKWKNFDPHIRKAIIKDLKKNNLI